MTGTHAALAEQATVLALEKQLGLKREEGLLQHSPFTLRPWQIQRDDWQQARSVARAIGRRLAALAADPLHLQQALAPVLHGASLQARLWQVWQPISASARRAHALQLTRVDLLHDRSGQWKLVEANSIAAGMGPFSEGVAQIQHALWPALVADGFVPADAPPAFAPNPAAATLAAALHTAAVAQMSPGLAQPVVVFVVEACEDNIFDQRKIAVELERQGSRVLRLTLAELDARLQRERAPACVLRDIGPVQALYFRTGYNLTDYRDASGDPQRLLALRAELETLAVALAPSIPLQLASAKTVQAHWFRQPVAGEEGAALQSAHLQLDEPGVAQIRDWSGWLLKSLGEGGGNVVQGDAIPLHLARLSAAEKSDWLLMQRIPVTPRAEVVPLLRKGRIEFARQLMSELGLFVLGDDVHDGGYLLRSKPVHALETGVHRGEGMIDVVAFRD